jgi:hypothetical protein
VRYSFSDMRIASVPALRSPPICGRLIAVRPGPPPSPRFPSLMHLASRLQNDNGSCNTDARYHYIWFDAVNTGFCYSISG